MTFAQTSLGLKGHLGIVSKKKIVVRPLLDYDYVNM